MDASYFVFASRLHHDFENGLHFHPLRPFGNEMASAFYALKATPGFILADINSGRIGRANCLPKLPGRGKGKPGYLTNYKTNRSKISADHEERRAGAAHKAISCAHSRQVPSTRAGLDLRTPQCDRRQV